MVHPILQCSCSITTLVPWLLSGHCPQPPPLPKPKAPKAAPPQVKAQPRPKKGRKSAGKTPQAASLTGGNPQVLTFVGPSQVVPSHDPSQETNQLWWYIRSWTISTFGVHPTVELAHSKKSEEDKGVLVGMFHPLLAILQMVAIPFVGFDHS